MILEIVQYGHPALRAKGRRIDKIDSRKHSREIADRHAAQQVGMPVQLCVIDVKEIKDRPSLLRVAGEVAEIERHMPLVLINPEIETFGRPESGVEGCLSFPGARADVTRPSSVRVRAQTLDGTMLEFAAEGLLARAVQHEHDHLHGILFIDRLSASERGRVESEVRGEENPASVRIA